MTAYWVVLAAVALTTLVAAVVGATLAAFAGQALPQAVRHELTTAGGTSISATAPVSGGAAAAQATATLKTAVGAALPGIPFAFWQASWSDPLGFAPGALRQAGVRPGREHAAAHRDGDAGHQGARHAGGRPVADRTWTGRRGAADPRGAAGHRRRAAAPVGRGCGPAVRPGLEHAGDVPDHRPGGPAAAASRHRLLAA